MSVSVALPKRVWTQEELQSLPDDGYLYEVVKGELIMSPKNNFQHGRICVRLASALHLHARAQQLGVVLDSSTGFWMHNRNCRAPDVSFIARNRLEGLKVPPRTFFEGAPDLAVKILAPSNTAKEITDRLRDYFESGSRLVWVIHPEEQFVEVCRSVEQRKIIGVGGFLEGEQLLPGFRFPIAELFGGWDWE